MRLALLAALLAPAFASPTFAALTLSQTEGAVPAVYANGGGSGFGGPLGRGTISMDVVGTDLVIAFVPGSGQNDYVGLFLDTRAGGFVDSTMNDTADGDRTVLTQLTLTQDDPFPVGVTPDFGVIFRPGGSESFELNGGSLNFQTGGTQATISIPLATLGLTSGGKVDFFAAYSSSGGYNSNESLPATTAGINQSGNPGFGDGQFGGLTTGGTYDNFNRFVVPEPTTLAAIGGVVLAALRRRK